MKSLIEKSTGKVLGFWPSVQEVSVSSFDPDLHEWDENAPDDAAFEDVPLYTVVDNRFVRGEKVDEKAALEDSIVAKVEARLAAKGGK